MTASSLDWSAVERALMRAGYLDESQADGHWTRATARALGAFQSDQRLPGTNAADSRTLEALFAGSQPPKPRGFARVAMPWLDEARRRVGLHERRDNSLLRRWLRSDGKTLGDPAKHPWCGDFVETAIALTLPHEDLPANPYGARNWLGFGSRVPAQMGAVLVFWRGSRDGWKGHVGFYVGEDRTHYHVLGGNQSNAVTVSRIEKHRLLGARWPDTAERPDGTVVRLAAVGTVTTNEH
ncbi:MAG: peptidoglycan-binding protein [Pseudomonadota bacterium]